MRLVKKQASRRVAPIVCVWGGGGGVGPLICDHVLGAIILLRKKRLLYYSCVMFCDSSWSVTVVLSGHTHASTLQWVF